MWILVVVVDGGVGLLDCNLSLSQVLDSGGDYVDFLFFLFLSLLNLYC